MWGWAGACSWTTGGVHPERTHVDEVSYGGLGWLLALAQPQRPELAAGVVPGPQQESCGRTWGGTRATDISQCE